MIARAFLVAFLALSQASCGCDCEDEPIRPPDRTDAFLGGRVFYDANRNGEFDGPASELVRGAPDPREVPVPNVTVTVFRCDGTIAVELLTDALGFWFVTLPETAPTDRFLVRYSLWPERFEAGFLGEDSFSDIQVSPPELPAQPPGPPDRGAARVQPQRPVHAAARDGLLPEGRRRRQDPARLRFLPLGRRGQAPDVRRRRALPRR